MMNSFTRSIISFITTATLLLAPLVVRGGVAFPETRAGEIASAYFAAFNSGDGDKIRAFEAKYRSAAALTRRSLDERVPGVLGYHAQIGTLDPVELKAETPNSISFICKSEKMDMYLAVKLVLEDDEPFKLETMQMMPTSAPSGTELGEWATLAELLKLVTENPKVPAVAVAVIVDGRVSEVALAGVRELGTDTMVEIDDRFHVGSISKSMTATMIARLVELGQLDWNTTIAALLTDFEIEDAYREVTVEQLLAHRGGVPPYTEMGEKEEARLARLKGTPSGKRVTFVKQVLLEDPIGAVGQHSYSNAGYSVVAIMAERAAGKSWELLMEEYVFGPTNMTHSGFGWPATPDRPDQPRGHFGGKSPHVQGLDEYPLGPYIAPAGDIHASINDLARFALLHLDGLNGRDGALEAASIVRLHQVTGSGTQYAAGWLIDGEKHWHAGSAGTFYAHIEIYPEDNRAVVIVTNAGIGVGAGVVDQIIAALAEGK